MVVAADDSVTTVDYVEDAEAGSEVEPGEKGYNEALGARIRAVRMQRGLSLQAVEALSCQEFKSSALGAYERGERSVSVARLQRLALLYKVPVDQMLPRREREEKVASAELAAAAETAPGQVAGVEQGAETAPGQVAGVEQGAETAPGQVAGVEQGAETAPEQVAVPPSAAGSPPEAVQAGTPPGSVPPEPPAEKVTMDLGGLDKLIGPEHEVLRRYVEMLQVQRQDFNGRVLTIRSEDLRTLGCIFGVVPSEMVDRLSELGILSTAE